MRTPAVATTRPGRLVAVGVLAGATSGLFGVGGGIVIVPGLVMIAAMSHKLATGTSLSAIIPISLAGVVGYATGGEVDWPAALCVAAGAMAGAVVGTHVLVRIGLPLLQGLFALAMLATAVKLFFDEGDGTGRHELTGATVAGLVLLGVASGILAGLLGVGGGIIIVPVLTLAFGVPHVLAKGTSLAVIVPTAVAGTLRNRRTQLTALRPAAIVGAAGVVSALVASRVALDLDERISRVLFGVLLVFAAARLVLTAARGRATGHG
ncbi:MAG: sulfite exporter TauE/SafE family protein [Acidimicrobiia bacterium]